MTDRLQTRLDRLRPCLVQVPSVQVEGQARTILFFSFTDGTRRAATVTASGDTAEEAWRAGIERIAASGAAVRWLRLDWVDAVERRTWSELKAALRTIKRNYFRLGIALDPGFEHAFLETEINANAMLYGGNRDAAAVLNEKNFRIYAEKRHGLTELAFGDDDPVWLFTTRGAFVGDDLQVHELSGAGLDAGRRTARALRPEDGEQLVDAGSAYLATQVLRDGRFHYGWHPCFDRPIRAYNALRHASTVYAMLEAWEVTHDDGLEQAIGRALSYLTGELIRTAPLPSGEEAAFLVDVGSEIKLGGNAVAILALLKHHALTGTAGSLALAERLGAGILHMQNPAAGSFSHVLAYPSLNEKERFRIIYYDGEAAFALMRLYEATGAERWLSAVERAFAYFIDQEHWKAHDHWLSYAVNELTRYRPEERYFRFGLDNFRSHLGFVLERITTFPTLLELMTAAESMVARLRADPERQHLLDGIDLARFYRALDFRAHYLLNGHFWPELAMFFARPEKIAGSFFIRHHAFRIRIDDVEHYLSGLAAYRRYLLARDGKDGAVHRPPAEKGRRHWTAPDVEKATGGKWLKRPPENWSTGGLCVFLPTFREGDMVTLRPPEGAQRGVPERQVPALESRAAAFIGSDAAQLGHTAAPSLLVDDVGTAILDLGAYARQRMRGKVVGVTGSAGKTSTVAMLAHAMEGYGAVGTTRHNANLPHGIAWNLASIPWDVPHVALELAIGRMAQNSRLTRPDVAIFTNILPAHLEYHRDLATIARRKSAIFEGMRPGGVAVLNREMAEWARVHMAARSRGLRAINYGRTPECEVRLIGYDPSSRIAEARIGRRNVAFALSAAGEHMALNALAVLAALWALGRDLEPALSRLATFAPLEGRGREFEAEIEGRRVLVLDEAYNANPGSMEAALALLGTKTGAARRIAVLGEMAELGPDAGLYHTRLAAAVARQPIDRVYALGPLYDEFWLELPEEIRASRPSDLQSLRSSLLDDLKNGDAVLFKGSHSTAMHKLVSDIASAKEGSIT
ncbi:Mur ligase family protein [Altererythrobacter sp. C41]|uniref:Mur ligase family protein n=1 Tax=Altererythrobacter sp. C41 TaxID=2806021 RepID=UPI001931B7E4|nr:glutamate ligase [Altererythrobacter sp. C41]